MATIVTRAGKGLALTHAEADANFNNLNGEAATNTAKVTNATHTGEVTGATVLTIADNAVINARLADMPTATFKGRTTAATGDPEDLTATQATALLNLASITVKGLAPVLSNVATQFLDGTGAYSTPAGGGAPGGATTQVQFNNAGAFAGATQVAIEGNQLRLVDNAAPVAPAAGGSKLTSTLGAGSSFPAFVNPAGRAQRLQRSLENSGAMLWRANSTLATIAGIGGGATSAVGVATLATPADTNKFTRMPRIEFLVTTAAVGAIAGIRVGPTIAKVGGAAGEGGFYFCGIWGPATGVATLTTHALFGLSSLISVPTSVEPSTLSNQIVMAWDAADTNIQIMHNLVAAAATKIDLGANFPVPTADRTSVYQLELFSPPGVTQSCSYLVTNLVSGATASGVITTNLPANTTLLTWRGWIGSGTTSAVIGFSFVSAMLEPF